MYASVDLLNFMQAVFMICVIAAIDSSQRYYSCTYLPTNQSLYTYCNHFTAGSWLLLYLTTFLKNYDTTPDQRFFFSLSLILSLAYNTD